MKLRLYFFPLLAVLQLLTPATAAGDSTAASRAIVSLPETVVDSTQITADPTPSKADSTRALDPAFAWTGWKDLQRAIALRPLDGPEDIIEKKEIIEDRLDDLAKEQDQLNRQAEEWQSRAQSLSIQLEVLDDLAELQRGGDLQLQQRLHTIRTDRRKAADRYKAYIKSLDELSGESQRLRALAAQYTQRADAIRRHEEKVR